MNCKNCHTDFSEDPEDMYDSTYCVECVASGELSPEFYS